MCERYGDVLSHVEEIGFVLSHVEEIGFVLSHVEETGFVLSHGGLESGHGLERWRADCRMHGSVRGGLWLLRGGCVEDSRNGGAGSFSTAGRMATRRVRNSHNGGKYEDLT